MLLHLFLLVIALSLDLFAAGISYGANRISLSAKQIGIINSISSLCLGASLLFGNFVDSRIPEAFTKSICFYSLLFLSLIKLSDSVIRNFLSHQKHFYRNIHFAFSDLQFIINIYANPLEADRFQRKMLSWKEAVFFSLAMSMDSLITGTMAAFFKFSVPLAIITAFLTGSFLTFLGLFLGHKISRCCPKDLSWLSGVIFLLLAFLKK